MKNFTYPLFFSVLFGSAAFAQGGNKVTICHIPPGNPANAHTIEVSVNAQNAHLNGNNQHQDFLGDCYSACNAMEVVSYQQGRQSNGTLVPANRSNPSKVLNYDGQNRDGEFFSLGFGGHIIIKMEGGIINRPGNDIRIFETSFNQPACNTYPERAEVWVSAKGNDWHLAGTVCQDGEIDIAPLDWIQYVKIVDVSDPTKFSGAVDGFDVDGISCVPYTPERGGLAFNPNATVSIFPNPTSSQVNILTQNITIPQTLDITLVDMNGKSVVRRTQEIQPGENKITVDVTGLPKGLFFLNVESDEVSLQEKLIVK